MALTLARFTEAVALTAIGDPVAGSTAYRLCVYDDAANAVATYAVARAGDVCGKKPCWRAQKSTGFKYRDPAGTADGIRQLRLRAGEAGKGRIVLKGANKVRKGQDGLPTGIASALENSTQATAQFTASDGGCFRATLTMVKRANGVVFKAIEK